MLFRDLILDRFWSGWIERFEGDVDTYITPTHPAVVREVDEVGDLVGDDYDKAKELWLHVRNSIRYSLSKKWKTPAETLSSGVGDCEDLDFLLLSMFPHYGITDGELVIGSLRTQSDRIGLHTWIEIDSRIIDPTGHPRDVDGVAYKEVERFNIQYEGF